MIIKWYGTAAISFSEQNQSVLFDPFSSLNKSLPSDRNIFCNYKNIFITHGHFDHLLSIPLIASLGEATIYCNQTAAKSLIRDGVKKNQLCVIEPGEVFNLGNIEITAYRGKHIHFDAKLVVKTLFNKKTGKNIKELMKIIKLAREYPAGEVFIFGIKTANKNILHLGSLNLDQTEDYPSASDLLTLPFQGRSDLAHYVLPIIEKLKPGALYLHHFDDSFPPISSSVELKPLKSMIATQYPAMKVYIPTYNQNIVI